MNVIFLEKTLTSTRPEEAIDVTPEVQDAVDQNDVSEGLVNVFCEHTSAGLIVTEGLWDLEEDVFTFLEDLIDGETEFRHNRYLDIDGRLAFNAEDHMKSIVSGHTVSFPVHESAIVKGSRQTIYFLEFDGPLKRYYNIQIIGE